MKTSWKLGWVLGCLAVAEGCDEEVVRRNEAEVCARVDDDGTGLSVTANFQCFSSSDRNVRVFCLVDAVDGGFEVSTLSAHERPRNTTADCRTEVARCELGELAPGSHTLSYAGGELTVEVVQDADGLRRISVEGGRPGSGIVPANEGACIGGF